MMKISRAGFTLAEVLTTLMVIGVVAAMTIPTLMNSTDEQQAKVACKKAASVLSQGIQLLAAKEIECASSTTDGPQALTLCMAEVMAGTTNLTNDTIATPDGMIYKFYTPESAKFDSIETTCGAKFMDLDGAGNCAVVVDTNGSKKGNKAFQAVGFSKNGFDKLPEKGTDLVAFSLSGAGVKPISMNGGTNKAYEYMYGEQPTQFSTLYCCTTANVCASGTTNAGKYPTSACTAVTYDSTCPNTQTSAKKDNVVSECEPSS